MAKIEYKSVSISYGDTQIVKNVDFVINKGEIVTLFGPSGSGKSSLMKSLLGMVGVQKGEILVDDKKPSNYKSPIAYVPQDNQLLPWLSVEQNINLWQEQQTGFKIPDISNILNLVNLYEHKNKKVYELSGGMKRRTSLARALALDSEVMCFDEVLVSIERKLRREIMHTIRSSIKDNNKSALIISHDFEEAIFMSDRVLIMSPSPSEIIKEVSIDVRHRQDDFFNLPIFTLKSKELLVL